MKIFNANIFKIFKTKLPCYPHSKLFLNMKISIKYQYFLAVEWSKQNLLKMTICQIFLEIWENVLPV